MRDPRPGFAKDQGYDHDRLRAAAQRVLQWVLGLTLCACGGAVGPSAPGSVSPPAAAGPAAPVVPRSRGVSLSYAAAPGCPGVDGYSSHVRARSSTLTLQPREAPASDSVDVKVDPAPDASGWVGRVTIAGTQALDREVRGERCEDVVAALALITVLRLEGADASATRAVPGVTANGASSSAGSASGAAETDAPVTPSARAGESSANQTGVPSAPGENPAPAAPEAPAPPANESNPSAPAASAAPTAAEAVEPVEPAPSDSAISDEQRAATRAREERRAASRARAERRALEQARAAADGSGGSSERRARASTQSESSASGSDEAALGALEPAVASEPWQWPAVSVGAAVQAGYASVPARAFKGLLQGELRLGEGISSWASTLSFAYARGTREVDVAKLGITLVTAELALCPPAFIDATRVWLRACAGVRGGGVHFVVTANDPNQDPGATWRPWLGVGPSLQLGVPLGGRWALRGVFDLAVQLIRDRFNIQRQVGAMAAEEQLTLYRPEALSFELGLALGYTF
jgi:hypothetical protein